MLVVGLAALVCSQIAAAATYLLPEGRDSVIGEIQYVTTRYEDTLLEIGRRYGVGYKEIVAANPGGDPWLPGEGTKIVIPTQYSRPVAPREGTDGGPAEPRLYCYPPAKAGEPRVVKPYPSSVGKMDWETPLGVTRIIQKRERPTWYPTE